MEKKLKILFQRKRIFGKKENMNNTAAKVQTKYKLL